MDAPCRLRAGQHRHRVRQQPDTAQCQEGHTIEKAYPAVDLCRRKGIEVGAFFMVGFPEETEETLQDTLTAIKKMNADNIMLSIFTPLSGFRAVPDVQGARGGGRRL